MANKIGPAGLVAGCTDETYGYMENMSVRDAVEEKEGRNGAGDIVAANFHARKKVMTATYIFRTVTGAPTAQVGTGTPITITDTDIGSGNWYVVDADHAKTQGDFYRISFTANNYPNLAS